MGLLNTLRFITGHPLTRDRKLDAVRRFASWHIRSRLAAGPVEVPFVDDTKLLVTPGQTGATGNIYVGLHELPEMALVLHLLRPGDLFVDVGANVGSYTILAAGAVGARCIAFEPDPVTARALRANVAINNAGNRVDVREVVAGGESGEAQFSAGHDTLNHVVAGGPEEKSITVPMTTLDESLANESPTAMKVDVEGFESDVVRGARTVLSRASLLAVIMETNGSGARYSMSDDDLHASMVSFGFSPCDYDPFARRLTVRKKRSREGNTIYIRDIDSASQRVKTAGTFDIAGRHSL